MPTVIGVARDGSADFTSVKKALEAIKALGGKEYELLLKSGDDFTAEGEFTLESNGKLGLYGGNVRPKVKQINTLNEVRDIFQGVHIYGIEVEHGIRLVGGNEDILLEEILFDHSELTVQHYAGKAPRNVKVSKGIWTGAFVKTSSYHRNSRPSNVFVAGIDGFTIEDSVMDYGGWHPTEEGAAANMFNHGIYEQYSCKPNTVVLRNIIIARSASHGVHGRAGGLYEDLLLAKNAIGLQMGYKSHPLPAGAKGIANRVVVLQPRSMVKGHDCGSGAGLITQARWGFHIDQDPGQGEFSYNDCHVFMDDDNETDWRKKYDGLISSPALLHKDAHIKNRDITVSKVDRTLEDYAASLGLPASFDAFMDKCKSRKVGEWDERFTAKAANAFLTKSAPVAANPKPPVAEPPRPEPVEPKPEPTTPVVDVKGDAMEIQAEKFVRYYDTTPAQEGTGTGAVDTAVVGEVTHVGWIQPGEWLEYDLDVEKASLYDLALVAGTGRTSPQTVAVSVDGSDAGAISVVAVKHGNWSTFSTSQALRVGMSKGKHTIRLTFTVGGVNLDKMSLTPVETVRTVEKIVTKEVIPANAVRVDVDGKKLAIWSE